MNRHVPVLFVLLLVVAAVSAYGDTINGCVGENGALRILVGTGGCRNSETSISWNSVGPQGPPGPSTPAPSVIGTIQFDSGTPIDIYDTNAEFSNVITFGGGGAGKVKFSDITIKKKVDATTPTLFLKCANGSIFSKAIITVHGAQDGGDLVVEIGPVFVDDVQFGSAPPPLHSLEDVSLAFGRIKVTAGGASACWSQITNSSVCP